MNEELYLVEIHWNSTNRIDTILLDNIEKLREYKNSLDNSDIEKIKVSIPLTTIYKIDDNFTEKIIESVKSIEPENHIKFYKELLENKNK